MYILVHQVVVEKYVKTYFFFGTIGIGTNRFSISLSCSLKFSTNEALVSSKEKTILSLFVVRRQVDNLFASRLFFLLFDSQCDHPITTDFMQKVAQPGHINTRPTYWGTDENLGRQIDFIEAINIAPFWRNAELSF